MTTTPHGRARYTKGCRCGVCREANRAYGRKYRARRVIHAVPDAQADTEDTAGTEQPQTGIVVAAVQAQLDDLGTAEHRPGLAAIAVKLAELLDNPLALPQHPAAAGRLVELLVKLTREQRRGGRLAAVRDMTSHSGKQNCL